MISTNISCVKVYLSYGSEKVGVMIVCSFGAHVYSFPVKCPHRLLPDSTLSPEYVISQTSNINVPALSKSCSRLKMGSSKSKGDVTLAVERRMERREGEKKDFKVT